MECHLWSVNHVGLNVWSGGIYAQVLYSLLMWSINLFQNNFQLSFMYSVNMVFIITFTLILLHIVEIDGYQR